LMLAAKEHWKVCVHAPLEVLQSLAVPSLDVVSTDASSAEKTAECTAPAWPLNVCTQLPVSTFQSLAVPSADAVRTDVPSEEKNAEFTASCSECPRDLHRSLAPSAMLQILALPWLAASTEAPSGEKTAVCTEPPPS